MTFWNPYYILLVNYSIRYKPNALFPAITASPVSYSSSHCQHPDSSVCTAQIPSRKTAWSIRSCHKQLCAARNITKLASVERLPENLPSGVAQKKGAVLVCNWFHSSRVQLYKSMLPGWEWGRSSTVVCLYSTLPRQEKNCQKWLEIIIL